ncbi:MAG: SPFH domain-containing protein [Micrococcales bacterium]|nr:SPFH domain-containing protein [Micrococcales bacterium]
MSTITSYPLLRHLKAAPTSHVIHLVRGRTRHAGTGLAFWYRPLTAALSEVPVDDRELPLVAHARTADFQDVTVQATVSYRFSDPALAAEHLDFSIDARTGTWTGTPLEQASGLLTELATGHVMTTLATTSLVEAVTSGVSRVQEAVTTGLVDDARLAATGLTVLGARIGSVRADADLERSLQTPAREAVQGEADKAVYERRALAVERERAIAENEMANRIELAAREAELVRQEGANAQQRATEAAAAALVEANADAERTAVLAQGRATAARLKGQAEAEAARALVAAHAGADPRVLMMLTVRQLAGDLPSIGQLTLTPDLVTGVLAGLLGGAGPGGRPESRP